MPLYFKRNTQKAKRKIQTENKRASAVTRLMQKHEANWYSISHNPAKAIRQNVSCPFFPLQTSSFLLRASIDLTRENVLLLSDTRNEFHIHSSSCKDRCYSKARQSHNIDLFSRTWNESNSAQRERDRSKWSERSVLALSNQASMASNGGPNDAFTLPKESMSMQFFNLWKTAGNRLEIVCLSGGVN